MGQQKILSDLQVREEERVHRETEILKELSMMNKIGAQNFVAVERHFRKMVRKILVLSLDKTLAQTTTNNSLGYGVSYRGRQQN